MSSQRLRILLLAAAAAGCSTMKVETEYNPGAPFASYRTYAWITAQPGPEQPPPLRDPRIRSMIVGAVDREMAKKGMVRVQEGTSPDFLVSVLGFSRSRVEVSSYGYAYPAGFVYGPYGPAAVAMPVAQVTQYTEGTMFLDFVDAKTKQLFWRGTASDTVTSASAIPGTIDEAVRRLLEGYPPKAK